MSEKVGYIKVWRKVLDNPVIFKDSDHTAIWFYILLNAVKFPKDIDFKGKRYALKSGQFSTGRSVIAKELRISETKVQRVLKRFESEHQIEQQMSNKCRIITILNWGMYQCDEHQSEQQVNNKCATSEQQVNTKKESKESKEREKDTKSIINNTLEKQIVKSDFVSLVFSKYLEICISLPKHKMISSKLEKQIKDVCKRSDGLKTIDEWEDFFIKVENSDFLTGRKTGWKAGGLLWITNKNNFEKIQADFYVNQKQVTKEDLIRQQNDEEMYKFIYGE